MHVIKFIFFVIKNDIWFILLAICLLALIYNRSLKSKRSYKCPHCGAEIKTEHMSAKNCDNCGAQLEETNYYEE